MTLVNVDAERLAELRAAVLGPVLVFKDPGYDEARVAWNGMYDWRRPAVIVQPIGVADVQTAIAFGRASDLTIAVRGGGHSLSGASTIDGGLLIDLSLMRGVRVDPERRVAVAAGGTLFSELDRETQAHGLATTGGMISHTGIAGLTLNGGVGRFMRKAGLTCDNVLGLDVVTADGGFIHADADSHPDLYWALRGGGGDFGIVTHFEYQLHPLGPIVYGGYIGWTLDQTPEVFSKLHDQISGAPEELQLEFILVTGPEVELIPPQLHGEPIVLLTITWMDGDVVEGERRVAPFRERVTPAFEMLGQFPYAAFQAMGDPLSPHGRRSYTYAGFLPEELSDDLLQISGRFVEECQGTVWPTIELYQMGGAVARVPKDATPASEFRDAGWYYIAGASWWDPSDDEVAIDWVRRLDAALEPFRLPGRYINFVSDDDIEGQRESLGDQTFARLAEVKAKYDPEGVFARNPNKPATLVAAVS
jgi:FAD/FMN-containing dehydrogenase